MLLLIAIETGSYALWAWAWTPGKSPDYGSRYMLSCHCLMLCHVLFASSYVIMPRLIWTWWWDCWEEGEELFGLSPVVLTTRRVGPVLILLFVTKSQWFWPPVVLTTYGYCDSSQWFGTTVGWPHMLITGLSSVVLTTRLVGPITWFVTTVTSGFDH